MIYREYVHTSTVAVYQKCLTTLGELITSSFGEKIIISRKRILFIFQRLIYRVLLFKHEFSGIWKWLSCSNDEMNHVEWVIKRDVYPQKMYSCSKNIRGISFLF